MQFVKMCSLAAVVMLSLCGSLRADSVTQGMVVAEYKVATNEISQDWRVYESSNVLQSEFLAGEKADATALLLEWTGRKGAAQAEFKLALNDFTLVANGLSASMPDAGSLGLLGCSGLLLLGALKRKFSR